MRPATASTNELLRVIQRRFFFGHCQIKTPGTKKYRTTRARVQQPGIKLHVPVISYKNSHEI